MEAAKDAMVEIVTTAGGRMSFDDMKAQLPQEHHKYMMRGLRMLKAENRLFKQIRVVDGQPVHEVFLPQASA